jgi:4'-phosphopantetheinyl transferase
MINGVQLWRASLDVPPAVLSSYAALLNAAEAERAARFVSELHRNRFIVSRGVLRTLLGDYTGTDSASIGMEFSEHGKPSLPGDTALHFNVSHSAGLLALAFAPMPVGVDPDALEIAERFFSPAEIELLKACPEQNRTEAFFTCWTRKEAYIKARGEGLSIPLSSFSVSLDPDQPILLEAPGWSLSHIPRVPGFAAALALEGPATIAHWRCYEHQRDPVA